MIFDGSKIDLLLPVLFILQFNGSVNAFAELRTRSSDKLASPVVELQEKLKSLGITDAEGLVRALPKDRAMGFTFVLDSRSNQPGERAILFSEDGSLFLGVGKQSHRGEIIISDVGTGQRSFHNIFPEETGPVRLGQTNPSRCAECHTRRDVFIMDMYRDWSGFVGGHDDFISHNDPIYRRLSSDKTWKSLFAIPHPKDSQAFPYHETKVADGIPSHLGDRTIDNMPNTRMTALIARLTGKKLAFDLRHGRPPLYERFKFALVYHLLDCDAVPGSRTLQERDSEEAQIHREYGGLVPREFQFWEGYYEKAPVYADRPKFHFRAESEILQILGINPDEIILKRPISQNRNPIEELSDQFAFVPAYRAYDDGSSMEAIKYSMLSELLPDVTREPLQAVSDDPSTAASGGVGLYGNGNHLKALVKLGKWEEPENIAKVCNDLSHHSKEALKMPLPVNPNIPHKRAEEDIHH